MTNDERFLTLIQTSFKYVYDNSIAEDNKKKTTAKVMRLKDLEKYLRQNMLNEFEKMLTTYDSLQKFFKVNSNHKYGDKDSESVWKCEVTTVNNYNYLKRPKSLRFPSLKLYIKYIEPLFIIYPQRVYDGHITLTDQINKSLDEHLIPKSQYAIFNNVRNRVNDMVKNVFSDVGATAELIGSAKKGLAINSSGIFMVIRIPSNKLKEVNEMMASKNWSTSPYNLEYLAMHLINIGMENIELIMKANRCKFDDPITGRECRISLNTGLVYERDDLILEYFKLDKRVKSLAAAVVHFTGRHHLHKSDDFRFPSTTCYILMVIHFLMCGLKYPVIVSLQNLPIKCRAPHCRFNRKDVHSITKFNHEIKEYYVKYHNCVIVRNLTTGEFNNTLGSRVSSKLTVWNRRNNSNLGLLLIKFFNFYSFRNRFTSISIIENNGKLFNLDKGDYSKAPIFVQDPFITHRNLTSTCKNRNREIIIEHFIYARDALTDGASFKDICESLIKKDVEASA
ncbi:hypothetical protein BD770DRAFT_411288 [Pilaira anomala]|nr:hypothetical protein BD770DRAFT_411288 [Pilaira anomala]